MNEPKKKKIPVTEQPIQLFKPMNGEGDFLALIRVGGSWNCVFLAPTAMGAKRKAQAWAAEQYRIATEGNKLKRGAKAVVE